MSKPPLSSFKQNFQELAMENRAERVVGTTGAVGDCAEGTVETKQEWVAPELRKFDIAEATANGGIFSGDGITSS